MPVVVGDAGRVGRPVVVTFLFGEVVTRLRAGTVTDPYSGEPIDLDWSDPDTVDIPGWGVDDSRSAEPLEQGRDPVVTDFVLYRPEVADVAAGDRVVVRGQSCEVVGNPATWSHPMTGWAAGFVVRANRVEG